MYELPSDITIYNVESLKTALINYLEAQLKQDLVILVLEASKVKDLDTAGLQLLLSFHKTCVELGIDLRIENSNVFFEELTKLTGANTYISRDGDNNG
ncbi:STAS domain-containing protein [Caldisalinibacter kiritimatiensis]|uniref:STAS domain-containing protein n=1 Tax=Caldisalinibacter kiritimatiensis TaxID=1304284 RepID=R1CAA4_9FIRM|nr:hypothetical protein L21TH_2728 [Caldisalinibacter kiritimatiensis]